MDINSTLAAEFKLRQEQIDNTVALIDDGKTIPFIARYRKELTGSLDDQLLREIFDRLTYLRNLEKRKQEITDAITEQCKMTDDIAAAISKAATLVEVEDIYRPYKPKRKTRASVARERGLETLAALILMQNVKTVPETEAAKFVSEEKEVPDVQAALQGAMDIIAEDISDDAELRKALRTLYIKTGTISSVAADPEEDTVYRNYYDYTEPVNKIAGHRVLALDRGEREDKLKVTVTVPDESGVKLVTDKYVKNTSPCGELVRLACEDGCKRLIEPSIEREVRAYLTENAAEAAIKVFASNLRQLLMQPPVKGIVTLGLDPGYRTGCKVAVVDHTGKVLETAVVHITLGNRDN
ncbi:MAG: Tex-like N-terminal domain-containing protein, partial [Oscillospiraceae bacterium]